MPDLFQVYVETIDSGNKAFYSTDDIPVTLDVNPGRVSVIITDRSGLKSYRKYNATITARNDFGESNSTGEILFSKLNSLQEDVCVTIL